MTISKITSLAILFVAFALGSCSKDDENEEKNKNVDDTEEINIIDGHEYVDLGLPSGTLWATCNVGAEKPEEYGDYFAWGETTPKEGYGEGSYKWCGAEYLTVTKYCTDSRQGTVDNKIELLFEDDAATANWGSGWYMPSLDQIKELYDSNCTTTKWTTMNWVRGWLITSKKNGNTLFLPTAGYRYYGKLSDSGCGGYWSRSLSTDTSYGAYRLDLNTDGIKYVYDNRWIGFSVRPVCSKKNK